MTSAMLPGSGTLATRNPESPSTLVGGEYWLRSEETKEME
jgi:hypothetical protein